jgi:NADPH:quinone reductase-like Zn-dependent oxidoreductase
VTSSSDEKLAHARQLGADATVNHRNEDVAARVKQLTGGGVHVVVETVGRRHVGDVALGRATGRADLRLRRDERAEPAGEPAPHLVEAADGLRLDDGTSADFAAVFDLVKSGRMQAGGRRSVPAERGAPRTNAWSPASSSEDRPTNPG